MITSSLELNTDPWQAGRRRTSQCFCCREDGRWKKAEIWRNRDEMAGLGQARRIIGIYAGTICVHSSLEVVPHDAYATVTHIMHKGLHCSLSHCIAITCIPPTSQLAVA